MNPIKLFPVTLGVVNNVSLPSVDFEHIKWEKIISPYNLTLSDISEDKNVIKSYSDLKKSLEFYIREYIENYAVGYKQDFQIVTSWFTRSKPNTQSEAHSHSNCWLSGVLHFSENGGSLKFEKEHDLFLPGKVVINEYTAMGYECPIKKGQLLIFPSKIKHRIELNTTRHNRYSMAFNILPKGEFGAGDSKFNWPEFNS
tara:strand:- start:43 stop:639 length:597 start_codon:yes stop_codon:yes gene_type:complete